MNGMSCGRCGLSPCVCKAVEQQERVKEGKEALDIGWQVLVDLPRWKMRIVRWLWPEFIQFVDALTAYYWARRWEKQKE